MVSALEAFAADHHVIGESLSAAGVLSHATIGLYDVQRRGYRLMLVHEPCEVLNAVGDVSRADEGGASLHIRAVLGLSAGTTDSGHLVNGIACRLLEVMLAEIPSRQSGAHTAQPSSFSQNFQGGRSRGVTLWASKDRELHYLSPNLADGAN